MVPVQNSSLMKMSVITTLITKKKKKKKKKKLQICIGPTNRSQLGPELEQSTLSSSTHNTLQYICSQLDHALQPVDSGNEILR